MVNRPGLISTTLEGKSLNSKTQLSSPRIWLVLGTSQQGLIPLLLVTCPDRFSNNCFKSGPVLKGKREEIRNLQKTKLVECPLDGLNHKALLSPSDFVSATLQRVTSQENRALEHT